MDDNPPFSADSSPMLILRFPADGRDGAADLEIPESLASELYNTLADHGLDPHVRVFESFDPGTAAIVSAIITANATLLANALSNFSRRNNRTIRIERRKNETVAEISGHSQRQEERLLEIIVPLLVDQSERNERRRKEIREMFKDDN